jgi:hypothetical protein
MVVVARSGKRLFPHANADVLMVRIRGGTATLFDGSIAVD